MRKVTRVSVQNTNIICQIWVKSHLTEREDVEESYYETESDAETKPSKSTSKSVSKKETGKPEEKPAKVKKEEGASKRPDGGQATKKKPVGKAGEVRSSTSIQTHLLTTSNSKQLCRAFSEKRAENLLLETSANVARDYRTITSKPNQNKLKVRLSTF